MGGERRHSSDDFTAATSQQRRHSSARAGTGFKGAVPGTGMGGERRHGSAVMGVGSKAVAAPVAGRWQLHDLSIAGAVMGAKGSAGDFSPFERLIGRASVM